MAREINLVPTIKEEMIKALKLRNFIFFLCIIVASVSIGAAAIIGVSMGAQQAALDSKHATLEKLSSKLNSYSDLDDFLTIKDQLGNIATLTSNKKVISRTFNILTALIPTGADTITISELNLDFNEGVPTLSFDAQANAGQAPFIDYNVLDAFNKSMEYMRYDYGQYVDKNGNTIPAYCMIETDNDGTFFNDGDKGIYAFWTINGAGCNPASSDNGTVSDTPEDDTTTNDATEISSAEYAVEDYNGQEVVRIWRTPQFNEWYREVEIEGVPYMSTDGAISNVAHFESNCITYTGYDKSTFTNRPGETVAYTADSLIWTSKNDSCRLVSGITPGESSNGRDSSDELVLRFSTVITLDPKVYEFSNTHMLALAPAGHYNVTDSYVQVQAMFGARAADCEEGDTNCSSNTTNMNGGN